VIRAEQSEDPSEVANISNVVATAFGSDVEAALVDAIRASPEYVPEWSLIAERDGRVVGHVMISYAQLVDGDRNQRVAMLSPLAVVPEVHGEGIGSALVRTACELADAAGEPFIVLEGSPTYYRRFGFEHAAPLGIEIPLPSWAPSEAGQVLRLRSWTPEVRGAVVYPPAFDGVTEH
jgi:putative acetyltransferase